MAEGFDYAGATYEELEAHAMWQDARVAALESENDRLRWLVHSAASLASEHCDEYGEDCHMSNCPWDNVMVDQEGKPVKFTCEIGFLYDGMRELGVEV